jgi:predicted RNA binding protein YcfA (HicA-like mRNA interferase family)
MKGSELLRLLKRDGWYVVRQQGTSHAIMRHDTKPGQLTVPVHGSKEIRKGTLKSILTEAQIKTSKR